MTAQTIDTDALRVTGTLILLTRVLESRLREAPASGPLTLPELSVLAHVRRGNDLPSGIARALRLDPGRITRLTDHLVGLGYLERRSDPSDRRRCVLSLTPTGEKRLNDGKGTLAAAMATLLEGLEPEERGALLHGLESVRRLVEVDWA